MIEKYYVSGCVDNGLGVDQVEDQNAEFWTLYARDGSGESEALADFADRRSAEAAMAVYVERDALGEQVRALAAEVSAVKSGAEKCYEDISAIYDTDGWYVSEDEESNTAVVDLDTAQSVVRENLLDLATPATDAILREVGSKAIVAALDSCPEQYDADCIMEELGISHSDAEQRSNGALALNRHLTVYAARIHAGEVPNV